MAEHREQTFDDRLQEARRKVAYHADRVAYAATTLELAESNWGNLWPWRWHKWWRTQREVSRRLKYQKATR